MLPRYLARSSRTLYASAEARIPQVSRPLCSISQSAPIRSSRHVSAARCYSATAETAKTEGAAPEGEAKKEEATKEDPVKTELEAKKREVVDVTDKWKRSIAEYRNLQAQTKREVQAAKDFALQRFAKDLIDSVDNLDRALSTVEPEKLGSNAELKNLHDGLKMTETILMQTLKKHGLERIDPSENSEKFDPNKHEATFQVPQPDKQDGTVFHTQSKGFSLNGRVLRAAKVGVVRNS